jgi:signal transduction histidine kinase
LTTVLLAPTMPASAAVQPALAPVGLSQARAWLARELHDGAVQHLSAMVIEIELLKRQTGLTELQRIAQSARAAVQELRQLLSELHEEPVSDTRFVESVREILDDMASGGITTKMAVECWPDSLPMHVALNLRRIVGEMLTNVRRHSGASNVAVSLEGDRDCLSVVVSDDGRGIDADAAGRGFGLRGLHERVSLLGGQVAIDTRAGGGTTISCMVPTGWRR